MIRSSAILIAAAIVVLVSGVIASSLPLVYASIAVSVLSAVLLAAGVLLRRGEIFGEAGTAAPARGRRPGRHRPGQVHPSWSAGGPVFPGPAGAPPVT